MKGFSVFFLGLCFCILSASAYAQSSTIAGSMHRSIIAGPSQVLQLIDKNAGSYTVQYFECSSEQDCTLSFTDHSTLRLYFVDRQTTYQGRVATGKDWGVLSLSQDEYCLSDIETSVGMQALFEPIYTNEDDGPGAGGGKP